MQKISPVWQQSALCPSGQGFEAGSVFDTRIVPMRLLFRGALLGLGVAVLIWIRRRAKVTPGGQISSIGYAIVGKDRSRLDPYPYVYVNTDGSARELHPDERDYLDSPFQPGDGDTPYVKRNYSQRNGWGDIAGFLKRSQVPKEIVIQAAPAENPSKPMAKSDQIRFLRDKGLVVTENPDGTFIVQKPRPTL
jgi:hypothetical protein